MPTTAEAIAAFLVGAGVRRIYGMPGGGSMLDVIEAARQRQIEFLLVHQEADAALLAATEGDLLDRPGVCLLPMGPGVASAAGGVAQASLDRSPLLVLSDRSSRTSLRLAPRQGLDHGRLLAAAVKDTATLTAPRTERLVQWAWNEALTAPRGPVHLDLPADEANRPARRHTPRPA
ncbi:MAG: thiamine pyrophosphate-binding protein, partial [candidate division NC10 bacterium]|nr:thiamine pyrophosphate-binding protein [candidate division NC10 bacterium]